MPLKFKRKTTAKSGKIYKSALRKTGKNYRRSSAKAQTNIGGNAIQTASATRPSFQITASPFQPSMWVKLTYGVNVALTTAGSSALSVVHIFRLNSLYDPDQTGTGHQPLFYDTLTALYERYQVYGCAFDLTCTAPNNNGLLVGVCARDAANTNSSCNSKTADYIIERRLTNMKSLNSTGDQKVFFKGYVKIPQVLGITKAQFDATGEGEYDAAYNASPTSIVVLETFLIDPNSLVATSSVRFMGTLTFYARMFEFKAPGQS